MDWLKIIGAVLRGDHIVTFTYNDYSLQHPRWCKRVSGCPFGDHLASLEAPPLSPGRYVMSWDGSNYPRYT